VTLTLELKCDMYSDELLAHFGVSMPFRCFLLSIFTTTPDIFYFASFFSLPPLLFFFPSSILLSLFYSSFFFSTSLGFRPNMRKAEEKRLVSESGILFINIEYFHTKSVLKLHETEYKGLWVYLTCPCFRGIAN
jgi:hypothetical protein